MKKRITSLFLVAALASSTLVAIAKEETTAVSSQTTAEEVVKTSSEESTKSTMEITKEVLASESFDDGSLDGWIFASGSGYSVKNGKLVFNNRKSAEMTSILLSQNLNVTNCDIQFDLKFESGVYFGMTFRAANANSLYSLRFYKNSGSVKLLKKVKNGSYTVIGSAAARVKSDAFSKVGIRLVGSDIMVYVDGAVALKTKDKDLDEGVIGFEGYNAKAVVDNIEIFRYSSIEYDVEDDTDKENTDVVVKEIYVKPGIEGGGDGTKENPIVGIERAVTVAKQAKRGNRAVNVIFTEGTYEVTESITLDSSISGTESAPVRFMAQEGAEVVFTGSKELDVTKFKPVTGKMEKRVHSAAQGNVRMMKFSPVEIPANLKNFAQRYWLHTQYNKILIEPFIFINDELQTLAEWPNGEYEIILDALPGEKRTTDANKGGSIMFSNTEPVNWLEAERPFVQGHLGVFWSGEAIRVKDIDLTTNQINLQYGAEYQVKKDHRWKMVNLIEELDIPGEYYIDEEESTLYIYPTHELTKEDTVEIGILETPMFIFDGLENFILEGIEIKNTFCRIPDGGWHMSPSVAHGIRLENNIKNVTIRGCEFHHIGGNAIFMRGGTDLTIEENYIHDIGHSGVMLEVAGDRQTLTPSEVHIRNNVISRIGIQSESNSLGCVEFYEDVVDVQIYNNLFSNTKNSAIKYKGNGHNIYHNEFSSVCNEMADAGAIYCGRSVLEWGTKIHENYFHDVGMKNNTGAFDSWAVFWDDELSGQEMTRNIINVNNPNKAGTLHMSGWDHVVENNTSVNGDRDWVYSQRSTTTRDWLDRFRTYCYTGYDNKTFKITSPAYAEKYPKMLTQLDRAIAWGNFMHLESVVSNNFSVNNISTTIMQDAYDYGTVENNVTIRENVVDDIFVDPDNHDFRVKDEAREKYNIPEGIIGEEFDLNVIGLQTDFEFKDKHKNFRLLAPANNLVDIQTKDVCLAWAPASAVEAYRYQIATDPEFKDIVQEDETVYTSAYPKGLANNMTYYWRVFGINRSRTHGFEQESVSGTFKFTTIAQDKLYTKSLEDKIAQGDELLASINEGTKASEYIAGTKDNIRAQIKEAQNFLAAGKGTQNDVEQQVLNLNMLYKGIDEYRNIGYETLNLATRKVLTGQGQPRVEYNDDGSVLLGHQEDGKEATYMLDEIISNYNVMKFRARLVGEQGKGWFTMGLRGQTVDKRTYSQDMYYALVKKDIFELQKKGTIYQTAPNKGKFKENDWNDVEFAAITTSKGVHLFFKLNGEVIFDYLDTTTPNYDPGMFGVYCINCELEIADATDVPDTLFQRSEEMEALLKDGATILGTELSSYSETGTWAKHPTISGFSGKDVRTSSSPDSFAMWQMIGNNAHNGKVFKVSYYHVPSADGDKNVKVRLENYMGGYETTVDMSKGTAGWVELGTFKFINASSIAECFITFTPSGNGVANVNAVKFELAEDAENMLK